MEKENALKQMTKKTKEFLTTKKGRILLILLFLTLLVGLTITLTKQNKKETETLFPPNTKIVPVQGEYSYANTTNIFQTYFKTSPVETDAILFENGSGKISFHTPTTQPFGQLKEPEATVQKNTITYKNIYLNTDLKYTVSSSRLLEEFIIHDLKTAQQLTEIEQIASTDLSYKENNDGSITFSKDEDIVFVLPKPVIYENDNNENNSYGVKYELKEIESGKLSISKVITQEGLQWLKETTRNYPIVIDLVIDNGDTAASWVSSDTTNLVVSQETSIKQEGSGSVKMVTNDHTGSGADGAITISSTTNINTDNRISGRSCADGGDGVNYSVTALTSTTATLSSSPSAGCLSTGDEILLINLQGTSSNNGNVGNYETLRVQGVSSNTVTFTSSKTKFYGDASNDTNIGTSTSNQRVMLQRVPNYTNVTVNGSQTFSASSWNGTKSGVFFFRANGTVTVTGSITVTALGYRGGTGTSCGQGTQGESYTGLGSGSYLANGGAGGSQQYPTNSWGGGAGGNYASGASGGARLGGTGNPGQAGGSYGSADLSKLYFGSGGGAGSEWCGGAANGSRGGGIMQIAANSITVSGSITAAGQTGANDPDNFGGGGGGAGGSVLIKAYSATLGSSLVTSAAGGAGNGGGGQGGVGRIRVESNSISGTTSPTASTTTSPDNSLNDTATLTISATDLSGQDSITFWVYASRTGGYSRFQFGEAASGEQTYDITISSANTWEQKTWDISAITGSSRNAVTKFAFKMTNSDQVVTYYFDDIQTVVNNVAPNTPTLDSPSDESTSIGSTPQLKTTATDDDDDYLRYRIELCEDEAMTQNCQTFNQSVSQTGWSGQDADSSTAYASGTQATYTVQSSLDFSTTYYWRSYVIDPDGTDLESETQATPYSFSTNYTPPAPTLNSPANSATNRSLKPQLKMVVTDADSDYIRYKVEVCTNSGMTENCNEYNQTSSQTGWSGQNTQTSTAYTSGTEATYTIQTALQTNTTYYWRASAIDPGGTNLFSTATSSRSFTTTRSPSAPTSLQTEGATNPIQVEDTTPEFSAIHTDPDEDSAIQYQIQVNTNSSFSGTTMWDSGLQSMTPTDSSERSETISYAGTTLPKDGTKYYWRIKFVDSNGAESPWSATANFSMWKLSTPGGCHVVKANDNSQITINWIDTNTAEDGYVVQRKVNGGSFSLLIEEDPDTTSYIDTGVSNGNTYQYRVSAIMGTDQSSWCTTTVTSLQTNHFIIL